MADGSVSADHRYTITEQVAVPWLGLFFGYGAMLPIAAGALAVWLLPAAAAVEVAWLTTVWAGAIVAFLSGVRRGLSFRSPRPDTLPQIITMLWLFGLAVLAFALAPGAIASGLLMLGFLSSAVFDTLAARREEAPPYFARLRPFQMVIPVVSLAVLLAWQISGR